MPFYVQGVCVKITPQLLVEEEISRWFLIDLHQPWLSGYDNAFRLWKTLSASQQHMIQTKLEAWLRLSGRREQFSEASLGGLQVQVLNVASRKQNAPEDPIAWIKGLDTSELEGSDDPSKANPPNTSNWKIVTYGLTFPDWTLLSEAWRHQSIDFRQMISRHAARMNDPVADTLTSASDLAWLNRAITWKRADEASVLAAFVELDKGSHSRTAITLLDQYAVWQRQNLVGPNHRGHSISNFVPRALAQLSCHCRPLDVELRRRAYELGFIYESGILRMDVSGKEAKAIGGDRLPLTHKIWRKTCRSPHLQAGVTLMEGAATSTESPETPIRAGYVETTKLRGQKNPMIVLLDIDLTKPESQFLGLKGRRIRFCDAFPGNRQATFTKVDLDGNVRLLDSSSKLPPEADIPPYNRKLFVAGRPLLTPFEGMREGGYLGSRTRIGGLPCWEQDPEVPESPETDEPMTFIAQFPHPAGGTAFLFLDFDELIAAVVTQWD